jgi:single-stranded-DNA-specific exonuclease
MDHIWKIKHTLTNKSPLKRRQEIITTILKARGLTTKPAQQEFLNPIHPKNLTPKSVAISQSQLTKALKRIQTAIKNQDSIYIYGDYDADGVCATAVLWETLHQLGAQVMPYLPPRDDKTRGLSQQGIDAIIKLNSGPPQLIITVDNGISSFKPTLYAKKHKIDVIITDHHQPKHKNKKLTYPKALAIVHSTQLAGVGVAWFLAKEISSKLPSLSLTSLGTIADMIPLIAANRSLVKFGLKKLQQTKRPGLQALAKSANISLKDLQTYQVSFSLAPRLNAMGRLEHALDALRLLCTPNSERAKQLAQTLEKTNQLRQSKTMEMFFHAKNIYLKQKSKTDLIFVTDKSFHEGIVGLVASRLSEKFNKPAIVVAQGKSHSKASGRSIPGFNLIKTIRSLESLLLEHGGHPLAAGFTAENQNLPKIKQKLEKLATQALKTKDLQPTLDIDCQIELADINWKLYNQLEKFRPFGFANPNPIFATKQATLTNFRPVGQDQKHLKLKIEDFDAIAFNFGHLADQLIPGQPIDIAYTLDKNVWNNQKVLQLKIRDFQST